MLFRKRWCWHTPLHPPTTHLTRAALVRCGRISLRAASSPPWHIWHGHPRRPQNRTCWTMTMFLIPVGKCSNNGYKSVKPIILYWVSFNREIYITDLSRVDDVRCGWRRVSCCVVGAATSSHSHLWNNDKFVDTGRPTCSKNHNQNVHLFDPHTIYIIAILTWLLMKKWIRRPRLRPVWSLIQMPPTYNIKWLKNGRCYSILGNVNVYTQGREILVWTMKWEELSTL